MWEGGGFWLSLFDVEFSPELCMCVCVCVVVCGLD